jgi:hypothetical protein
MQRRKQQDVKWLSMTFMYQIKHRIHWFTLIYFCLSYFYSSRLSMHTKYASRLGRHPKYPSCLGTHLKYTNWTHPFWAKFAYLFRMRTSKNAYLTGRLLYWYHTTIKPQWLPVLLVPCTIGNIPSPPGTNTILSCTLLRFSFERDVKFTIMLWPTVLPGHILQVVCAVFPTGKCMPLGMNDHLLKNNIHIVYIGLYRIYIYFSWKPFFQLI